MGPAGTNFGWPWYEGREGGGLAKTSGYQSLPQAAPFYAAVESGAIHVAAPYNAFGHAESAPGFQNQVITGGDVFYTGGRYPLEFQGDYFFTDFFNGSTFVVDTNNRLDVKFLFPSEGQYAPVHFDQGADGYVYYSELFGPDFSAGSIGRLHIFSENDNLLVNGSFEQPVVPVGSSNFAAVTGWTAITGGRIEIWKAHNGVVASDGVNFLELDYVGARDGFFQDVQTEVGETYTLAFDLRTRLPARPISTQGVEVLWNGVAVDTVTPSSATWESVVVSLVGTGGLDRLTIRDVASQGGDGWGAMLDNFGLYPASEAVPPPPPPPSNLLVNGSFEQPVVPVGSSNFGAVTGWTAITGGRIEIWKAHNSVVASNGVNFLELDYIGARDGFSQSVQTVAGQTYELSFDFRTRLPVRPSSTQAVEVVWNGVLIDTVTRASATWTTRSFTVTGTGGLDSLTIREVAGQGGDGYGAMLDNFSLIANGAPNAPPNTNDDAIALNEDSTAALAVLTNDTDPEGVPLTVTHIAGQAVTVGGSVDVGAATVTRNANGTLTIAPDANFSGPLNFAYTASDGAASDTANVAVTVNPLPDPPVVAVPLVDQNGQSGQAFAFTVPTGAFTDPDGDALTYTATLVGGGALPAWLTFNPTTRTFSGTPPAATALQIQVSASDGSASISDVFALAVLDSPSPGTNLLVNGSFEQPLVPGGSSNFDAVTGWTAIAGGRIEIWKAHNGIVANDGVNFLELDYSTARDGFSQSVQTVDGTSYDLSFDFRTRLPARSTSTQAVEVVWNGVLIDTLTPASATWTTRSFTVTGTGGLDTLTFREVASQGTDGYGAMLDNFSLVANDPPPNLLVNGSFEQPLVPGGSSNFDAVTGWTAIAGGRIEIWKAHNGIVANDGVNFLELDYSTARDGFSQSVQTVDGTSYDLSFDFRTRLPARSTSTQAVEVVWNGVLIDTVTPASATWTTRSFTVTGTGGLDTLTFREVASQGTDGYGAMLDNFSLVANDPPPNLLVNGSFEQPLVPVGSSNFGTVTGWTAITGGRIEIWKAHNGVVASNGVNFLELDYIGARDGFSQAVQTVDGASYELSFDFRTRLPARSTSTQGVEVVWNGVVVDTVTPASATWTTMTFDVTGTGGLDTLTIREVASQGTDGYGAMLDNFSLITSGPSSATLMTADAEGLQYTGPISDPPEALGDPHAAARLPSFDTRHHSFGGADSTGRAGLDYSWSLRLGQALNSNPNENFSDDGRHHDRHVGQDHLALHQAEPELATLLGAHLHLGNHGHV